MHGVDYKKTKVPEMLVMEIAAVKRADTTSATRHRMNRSDASNEGRNALLQEP